MANIICKVYLDAQEGCGLKVGDWAEIIDIPTSYIGGWRGISILTEERANLKNKVGQIKDIDKNGISVLGFYWPYFCLRKTSAPKPMFQFKPFDKVLVRDENYDEWMPDMFLRYNNKDSQKFIYKCFLSMWKQCIPYEKYKSFNGTTWEFKE